MSEEKPAHILEIPDSLGRDIDKARADPSRPAIPIESFMSDQALETAEALTRRAEPVHAEDLTPISHADARQRTTFDGEHMIRAPATRRVIPAPFRRQSIDLIVPGEKKPEWVSIRADQVLEGDIVVDIGKVVASDTAVRRMKVAGVEDVAVGTDVTLTGAGGVIRTFDAAHKVRAFHLED